MLSTVGERLAFARTQRGLTQTELAERSGIAQTHLSRYEAGKVAPRKLALARLSQALAISMGWLETGAGEMEEYPRSDAPGLTIKIDGELAQRLRLYCEYNGVSLPEAVAEFLDFPLSAFSPEVLPKTPEEQAALKRTLQASKRTELRRAALATHITVS